MSKTADRRDFGNIRKLPSGNFQARYTGPDVRVHRAPTTFVRRTHAEKWLVQEHELISAGHWTPPEARQAAASTPELPTVAQWLETVIERRARRTHKPLAPTTIDPYRKDARLRIVPGLGPVRIDQLTRAQVASWWDGLDQTTPTTNARAYKLLQSALTDAVDDELIEKNPCRLRGVGKPAPKHQGQALTVEETLTYLGAVPPERRVALMLAAWCGLRSGEVRGLRRRDVNLDARTVTVAQAVSRVRTGPHKLDWRIAPPKTAASLRTVAMPEQLVEPLRAHLASLPMRGPDALIFTAADGVHPLGATVLGEAHAKGRNAVGRPELRVHDLRRTAATLAAQGGATTREVMRLLGHTTVNVAMIYQVADDARDRSRADVLTGQLRGIA